MKILYNARIYSLDADHSVASAIAIEQGQVVAIGDSKTLISEFSRAQKQDMSGAIILPGLTDAHLHLQQYALSLKKINCETDTLKECLSRVKDRISTAQPGEWVLGHGWNHNNWRAWPSTKDLDLIAPNNPVYLTAKSLHAGWTNSAALKLADISTHTPDPPNGQLQRNNNGKLTGILLETAMELVSSIIPEPSFESVAEAIEGAQPILWQMGLTGLHDFDQRTCFLALQYLHSQRKLKMRVTKSIPVEKLSYARELGLRTGFGDDWLRIGSVKVFMDGALGQRTAAMIQSYDNEPENRGILNMDAEELFQIGCLAVEVGLSLAVHAIGDRANHETLNAFDQLRKFEQDQNFPKLRHRIEHVQIVHPDDAGRLSDLGIIASMQPFHAISDMYMSDQYWGERAANSYAWQSQANHGAILALGSDAPVESPNPFLGLYAAVTRQRIDDSPRPEGWYPEQCLSLDQAIKGYTIGPAYAGGVESRCGKLAAGYLADLIALEQDPFENPPTDLLAMTPLATMVGGEWVWQS